MFDGPLDTFGECMVEFILGGVDQHSLDVFLEVLRASGSNGIRRRMGQMTDGSFSKLKDQLPVTDSVLRTRLVVAQVTGLLVALAACRQDLSAKDRRQIIRIHGAAIQSAIAPD